MVAVLDVGCRDVWWEFQWSPYVEIVLGLRTKTVNSDRLLLTFRKPVYKRCSSVRVRALGLYNGPKPDGSRRSAQIVTGNFGIALIDVNFASGCRA